MKIGFEKDANVKSTIVLKYGFHSFHNPCNKGLSKPKI